MRSGGDGASGDERADQARGGLPAVAPRTGFKLEREGQLLGQLVAYLETAGASTLTSELAVAWAREPAGAQPNHWAKRLSVVRRFATYLQTIDPTTQAPPPGVFPARRRRPTPYLWSHSDICRLLDGARALRSPMRAATHEALFGLLAASGMRVGEVVALQRDDLDLDAGVITVREAKFDRSRLVPLHPTTTEAVRRYAAERDRLCPRPRSGAFFLSSTGTALDRSGVSMDAAIIYQHRSADQDRAIADAMDSMLTALEPQQEFGSRGHVAGTEAV